MFMRSWRMAIDNVQIPFVQLKILEISQRCCVVNSFGDGRSRYDIVDTCIYFYIYISQRVCVCLFAKGPGVRELVLIASVRPVDLRV